jgi:lysophospholipase L1-like esterase
MPPAKVLASILLLALATTASAQSTTQIWLGSWAASQQIPEPRNALPADDLRDATVRQIVRLSVGGTTLRLHLSNAFGTESLKFTSVHIARPISNASSAIDPASDKALTFSGATEVIVPAGASWISDPIDYPVVPLASLAISFHLNEPPTPETSHPGSRATTWYLHGDSVSAASLPGAKTIEHWYQISGIDVLAPTSAGAIVALGDSITDGHATTTNGNDRWTDVLAERLQASSATRNVSVLNHGIGGNHLLVDGLGPNAMSRFDRDVLGQAGARWLIVFEAINDLGGLTHEGEVSPADHAAMVVRILFAYRQFIVRAHSAGIRVIGATITPDGGSFYNRPGSGNDADREAINAWIRMPGHVDEVIDFDKAVRDPSQPDRLLPAYDCGDHLHPNPAGYRAMGESVPLALFAR